MATAKKKRTVKRSKKAAAAKTRGIEATKVIGAAPPAAAVPADGGKYWSPNGYHRLGAMKQLGARAIVALVVPEPEVAHRILALNTEKAHNLRERALEVSRLAAALAELDDRPEKEYAP